LLNDIHNFRSRSRKLVEADILAMIGLGGELGGLMATIHAVMFGIALALTPSLVTLAFFLYRDWILTRDEYPKRLEPHDWSLHC
jgi:hypothetical protein